MKLFTIILFAVTYILMIALPKKRPYVALISAVIFVVSGAMPLASVFTAIDWNVLLMLAGTMGTVALFIESKMPERMADLLLQKTPNVMWVAVALSVFAGVVSAFVDNVATVLMIAPVALSIAKKLKMSPVAPSRPICRVRLPSSAIRRPSCWEATPTWTFWTSSSWTANAPFSLPLSWVRS